MVFDGLRPAAQGGVGSRVCDDNLARRRPTDTERSRHDGESYVSGDELTAQLYREHAAPLLRYVLGLTGGDRHHAEDIVQETLLRAWRNSERLAVADGSVRPWLVTVARRLVIDQHRRRQARPSEVSDAALEFVAAEDDVSKALSTMEVSELLDTLTPSHREALVETYLKGRTVNEAAAKLGIPPGTVKSRVYYGLRSLKLALAERGLTS
jgi:RNA polymerase sigma-70 factor (ECF subfamily)